MPDELKDQVEETQDAEDEEDTEEETNDQEEGSSEEEEESEDLADEVPAWAEELKSENQQLKQQLGMLVQTLQQRQAQEAPKEKPQEDPFSRDFVSEETMDDVLSSPKKLNGVLNSVAKEVAKQLEKRFQDIRAEMPKFMQAVYSQQEQSRAADKKFWVDHPELLQGLKDPREVEARKRAIGGIANDILSKSPNMDISELMKITADEARLAFGIPKPGQRRAAGNRAKKASRMFGDAGSGRAPKKTPTSKEQEQEARRQAVREAF